MRLKTFARFASMILALQWILVLTKGILVRQRRLFILSHSIIYLRKKFVAHGSLKNLHNLAPQCSIKYPYSPLTSYKMHFGFWSKISRCHPMHIYKQLKGLIVNDSAIFAQCLHMCWVNKMRDIILHYDYS